MAKKPAKGKDTPAQGDMSVSGNVMFYGNPQPLSKDKHKGYGVTQVAKPFDFMSEQHFMPLTAAEFAAASASYPVVFAGEARNPIGIMGIRANENLFVNEGMFNNDFYLPAFARRYPFVLAGDQSNDRFVVCVDEDAECVTKKNPVTEFFAGEDTSQFTKDAFEFLQNFERDRQATVTMIERFKALDLFEPKDMHFQGQNPDGTPAERQKIADYFAVSAEKLAGLDEATMAEFVTKGYMAVAYAHITSLNNWQRLVNMTLRKANAAQAN